MRIPVGRQWLAAIAAACLLAGCTGAPERPATSADGLQLVVNDRDRFAYQKPGADFSRYDKIQLLDASVAFKDNWMRDQNRNRRGNSRVTEEDMTRIRQRLSETFRRVFAGELEKGGYTVVTEAAADVLRIKPAIVELDVTAPDLMEPGRTTTFVVDETGRATLQMELFDSLSGELLARTEDRRTARTTGRVQRANSVTNRADADRVIRRWARTLLDGLEAVRGN
jgi:hypothetical protein